MKVSKREKEKERKKGLLDALAAGVERKHLMVIFLCVRVRVCVYGKRSFCFPNNLQFFSSRRWGKMTGKRWKFRLFFAKVMCCLFKRWRKVLLKMFGRKELINTTATTQHLQMSNVNLLTLPKNGFAMGDHASSTRDFSKRWISYYYMWNYDVINDKPKTLLFCTI